MSEWRLRAMLTDVPEAKQIVTPEMVREMEAHLPFEVAKRAREEHNAYLRWEWIASYFNRAIREPHHICTCCGISADGTTING